VLSYSAVFRRSTSRLGSRVYRTNETPRLFIRSHYENAAIRQVALRASLGVLHSFRETTTPSLVQSFPATFWASVLATGFACSRSNPYTRTSNAFFPFLTTSPRPARFVPL
jgi:hypothetical protein